MSNNENENANAATASADDVYAEWMDDWKSWPASWALSIPRNCEGRPVWEPPILDYSEWIGEKYEKKREAMLKWTNGDVARMTDIMDVDTELDLLWEYKGWAGDNADSAVDSESRKFFEGLWKEVYRDWDVVIDDHMGIVNGLHYSQNKDGTYRVTRSLPSDPSPEDSSSKRRDNIPDNASYRSSLLSPTGDSNSNRIATTLQNHPIDEHTRISSPTDEAEELPG